MSFLSSVITLECRYYFAQPRSVDFVLQMRWIPHAHLTKRLSKLFNLSDQSVSEISFTKKGLRIIFTHYTYIQYDV